MKFLYFCRIKELILPYIDTLCKILSIFSDAVVDNFEL